MIKAIALDLDNTLLNNAKEISPQNQQVLKQLHQKGIKIILCSGRPKRGIYPYLKELNLLQPGDACICYNGGLVELTARQQKIAATTLPKTAFQPLSDLSEKENFIFYLVSENQVYALLHGQKESPYEDQMGQYLSFTNTTFSQVPANSLIYKAVVINTPEKITEIGQKLRKMPQFHITRSRTTFLEILPSTVNKAAGLKALLHYFGFKREELIAFGDEANDQEMLNYAGIGVAMGNATPELQAIADQITLTNEADGVAAFLKPYFKIC